MQKFTQVIFTHLKLFIGALVAVPWDGAGDFGVNQAQSLQGSCV